MVFEKKVFKEIYQHIFNYSKLYSVSGLTGTCNFILKALLKLHRDNGHFITKKGNLNFPPIYCFP